MTIICRALINASNLHVGGGVQVAVSFLDELSRLDHMGVEISVLASSAVDANLRLVGGDVSKFSAYRVYDTQGILTVFSLIPWKATEYDVIFTVFGPLYCPIYGARNIVGFAQPWIIYPENEVYRRLSFLRKARMRVRSFFQSIFFRRADLLVVEVEHVRSALARRPGFGKSRIAVVHNCVNSIYFRPERWLPLSVDLHYRNFSIGFVGRDYPHKNTDILPYIRESLSIVYGLTVDFYVTFTAEEWSAKSDLFRSKIVNAGEVSVAQCPTFYEFVDAVIFPSLLECFSATPLEAMVMQKPLFASDRPFVRDICGEHALYFNPEDPADAAALIARYIGWQAGREDGDLLKAREHVLDFSNARTRATSYLSLIRSEGVGGTDMEQ